MAKLWPQISKYEQQNIGKKKKRIFGREFSVGILGAVATAF